MSSSNAKNIVLVISISIITKIIGLVKQIVIADYYGMTGETDAFLLISGTINDFGSSIFSALSIVFLADYIRIKKQRPLYIKQFTSNVITLFCSLFIIVILCLELFAPFIVKLIAPGLTYGHYELAVKMMYFLAPMLVVLCLRTVLSAILDAENHFWYGKSLGAIQSAILIVLSVFFYYKGIFVLVFALILTYFIEAFIGLYFVIKNKYYSFCYPHRIFSPETKNLLVCMIPLFFSNSLSEINALVARGVSSNLGEGFISSLSYAQTLKQFVNTVLITSTLTVLYTNIVRKNVGGDTKSSLNNYISKSIVIYMLVLVPVSIVFYICANDIVSLIYGHGAVTHVAVQNTSFALKGYSFGYLPFAMSCVLLRVFYSDSDTWYPLLCNMLSVALNVFLTHLLSKYLGIMGISISTSISYLTSFLLLSLRINKKIGNINWKPLISSFFKIFVAFITVLIVLFIISPFLPHSSIYHLILIILISYIVFYLILVLTKCNELSMLIQLISLNKLIKQNNKKTE